MLNEPRLSERTEASPRDDAPSAPLNLAASPDLAVVAASPILAAAVVAAERRLSASEAVTRTGSDCASEAALASCAPRSAADAAPSVPELAAAAPACRNAHQLRTGSFHLCRRRSPDCRMQHRLKNGCFKQSSLRGPNILASFFFQIFILPSSLGRTNIQIPGL